MSKWQEFFGQKAVTQDFTKETLMAFLAEIDADPLAGMGCISKRERFVDRVIAQHRIVLAQHKGITPRMPAPVLTEQQEAQAPLDLKAAQLAKKAGM